MECDPLIEIVKLAREKWPAATSVDVWGPRYVWTEAFGQNVDAATIDVQERGVSVCHETADSLAALRDKLKEMKEAEDD